MFWLFPQRTFKTFKILPALKKNAINKTDCYQTVQLVKQQLNDTICYDVELKYKTRTGFLKTPIDTFGQIPPNAICFLP